jgi:carboxyl-terminal processing protease
MIRLSLFRQPRRAVFLAALALAAPGLFGADHKFITPDSVQAEARLLVEVLQKAQYNRDNVHSSDYAEIIPDYMTALDPPHMFFLASDAADFSKRYGKNVYDNVAILGNIDPAYNIFYTYQDRAEARIHWIFAELKRNFDFTTDEAYAPDRMKAPWPSSPEAADDLWHRRVKYELILEMLNKKSLDQAKEIVRKRYERVLKSIGELDASNLAEIYLRCMTQLYDPHSEYLSADTFDDFAIQMKLQLVGIGAMLGTDDEDYCEVRELVPGGPADLGGQLKPKDRIVSVSQDGQEPVDVIGMPVTKIVPMIRGDKGTRVHLVVQPADAADPSARKEIIITRDVVNLDSSRAHAAVFQVPGPDGKVVPLGVITLSAFYGAGDDGAPSDKNTASQDVGKLIGELKQAGVQGLVLDLRHNGGGYLSEAVNVAGLFLPAGPVVQVKDSDGEDQIDASRAPQVAYDGPMAVLVDRFSASASEIVAGALQNYGRAIVVGDRSTHGKGTVQTVLEMKSLSQTLAYSPAKTGAAKITIQKFYLPNGSSTQLRGVTSDIVLPSADEFLPIGETDLPHALVWDQIPGTPFDGKPLDRKVVEQLREDSLARQNSLEEFTYLRKNIDRFKERYDEKLIPLNLDERRKQEVEDTTFKKEMDAERDLLAKNDYSYKEFRLGPPLPVKPKAVAPKKAPDASAAPAAPKDSIAPAVPKDPDDLDDDDSDTLSTDKEDYAKVDVELRESLRILEDAVNLGHNPNTWADNHAPLTVAETKS